MRGLAKTLLRATSVESEVKPAAKFQSVLRKEYGPKAKGPVNLKRRPVEPQAIQSEMIRQWRKQNTLRTVVDNT